MSAVVVCDHVVKSYGNILAVNDISFSIEEGEIFGLVGPNGAGKTTLIEMIESLRMPDSGSITVLGFDPSSKPRELQEKIGVQLQTTSIQPNIKVGEAVTLFASLYHNPLPNPLGLLEALYLEDKANTRFKKLSGGQKQRVAIALALVNNPKVLFFDEITTGLDPQARRSLWALVKNMKKGGKTVFLTTHYMEEAEELCDRVGVVDRGKIIALDTPKNLIRELGTDSKVVFRMDNREDLADGEFNRLTAVTRVEKVQDGFILYTHDSDATLMGLVRLADTLGVKLSNIHTEIPDLEDVFLTLAGREYKE